MTAGLIDALGAMVSFGAADLVYKRGARAGVPAHQFVMVQGWCFAPAALAWGILTGTLDIAPPMLWGCAAGLFIYTAFFNFAHSLKHGSVTVIAPIFRLSFAITAMLAVLLLGEPLTPFKIAGLVLTMIAVWLLLGGPIGGGPIVRGPMGNDAAAPATQAPMNSGAIARLGIATLALGIANLLYKVGLNAGADPASMIVGQSAVFVLLSTGVAASVDRRLTPRSRVPLRLAVRHAGLAALFLLAAFILTLESLARGQASVLVPITQMGFVVTVALGCLVLREPFTGRKALGLAVAVAAIVTLARG